MAVSNLERRQNLILAGIVFLTFAIPLTILAFRIAVDIRTSAKPTEEPQQVFFTNLTDSSATISWITPGAETEGFVEYGTSADSLTASAFDERDTVSQAGSYKTHSILIRNLNPETDYFYQIVVGDDTYTNAGTPYSFTTLPSSEGPSTPDPVSGTITPAMLDALIYFYASDGNTRSNIGSTLTNSSGNYTLERTTLTNVTSGGQYSLGNADIIVFAQGVDLGTAQTQFIATQSPSVLSLSTSNSAVFNPTANITLLPRGGSDPKPTPTQENVVDTMIKSSYNIDGYTENPTIPFDIKISNISDTAFTISWLTKEATTGAISYGIGSLDTVEIDDRDGSLAGATKRFSHSVSISDSTFSAGKTIQFEISSNSKLYGNGSLSFEYEIPPLLSSPPGIDTLTGSVDPEFDTTIGLEDVRDFLITARKKEGSSFSTWISTVPAANQGWNLNVAATRSQDLSEVFDSYDSIELNVNGELNSEGTTSVTSTDDDIDFTPGPGLSIIGVEHEDEISVLEPIQGSSSPSSTIAVTFTGEQDLSKTATSDTNGEWDLALSDIKSSGEYDLTLTSSGEVLGLSLTLQLEELPDTAFKDYWLLIIGTLFLLMGMGSIYYARESRLEKSS